MVALDIVRLLLTHVNTIFYLRFENLTTILGQSISIYFILVLWFYGYNMSNNVRHTCFKLSHLSNALNILNVFWCKPQNIPIRSAGIVCEYTQRIHRNHYAKNPQNTNHIKSRDRWLMKILSPKNIIFFKNDMPEMIISRICMSRGMEEWLVCAVGAPMHHLESIKWFLLMENLKIWEKNPKSHFINSWVSFWWSRCTTWNL